MRKFFRELCTDGHGARCVEQVGFRDHDDVRLLKLLAINVGDLVGKFPALRETEQALGANRIYEHAQRRDGEGVAVNPPQRIRDRRDEIRAAPDRLGDEDVGPRRVGELLCGICERVEAAAETTARDLLRRKALRAQHRRIHEFAALVVRDETDAQPLRGEMLRDRGDGGRLSRSEEAADHHVAGLGLRIADCGLRIGHHSAWEFCFSRILSIVVSSIARYCSSGTHLSSGSPSTS